MSNRATIPRTSSRRCTARTRPTGELTITFGSGSELLVDAHTDVESWAVAGPDGFLIVCLARGEVAVWGDAAADPAST
jgi:hypothetical protein